ncbi:MAG: PEP-CTERM sorting domain-containing protein [Gemmatimonadaceae bacterium]
MSAFSFRMTTRLLAAACSLAVGTAAYAQPGYFDRTPFTSALSTSVTNDLNSLANGATSISFGALGTGTLSGATVNNGAILNTGSPFSFSIAFSQMLNGFGADFFSGQFGGSATFHFFNGATPTYTTGLYSFIGSFRGVIPTGGAFNRVDITEVPIGQSSPSLFSSLDNLTVGVITSTVPEPSSIALLGAGILALGIVARRKKQTAR